MPANFSNVLFKYQFEGEAPNLLYFNLRSIYFDINQVSIVPNTPFTTELGFEMKLEKNTDDEVIASLGELEELLSSRFSFPDHPQVVDQMTEVFGNYIFNESNFIANYIDIGPENSAFYNVSLFDSSSLQTNITSVVDEGDNPFDWVWNVKLKFKSVWGGTSEIIDDTGNMIDSYSPVAAVLFPQITVVNEVGAVSGLELFNNELRLNYEVLFQQTSLQTDNDASEITSSIGKASDELTDSISHLTNTLHSNLSGTFSTRLQPVGSIGTNDLALWLLILKGTESLSYQNFENYMDAIFCTTNHNDALYAKDRIASLNVTRSLPFMNVDAYRSIKIAAEAFVMVNCMVDGVFTDEDVKNLNDKVPLTDGNVDKQKLDKWWESYQEQVLFGQIVDINADPPEVRRQSLKTIPYLAVIKRKMNDQDLKMTPFDAAFRQYLDSDLDQTANTCFGLISERLSHPCYLELIWSYWHEESMMVQGLNAISRRFQNVRAPGRDPLASLELDPLRPLNNLLWGYVQDEQHRLTVRRRAYEYDHHYGIHMEGTITKKMRYADSRSKFIEAFHRLLNLVSRFYNQADDMTVNPDSYPVLNGLKEVHMILSEGAHNQYGDLPSTARAEMLTQQWLLARPEFRQFLSGRTMVAYPEPWMEPVATTNTLMGWTQSSPLHFRDLGRFGEQLLLSIRFGNWSNITDRRFAANWSHFWREQIQGYIHSYRAVTGVDLSLDTVKVDTRQPSYHLLKQLQTQRKGKNRVA